MRARLGVDRAAEAALSIGLAAFDVMQAGFGSDRALQPRPQYDLQ